MTPLTDSRFHMWRALFALAHVDGHVADQERKFMRSHLSQLPVTDEQREILQNDIDHRQEVALMFSKISADKDMDDFFRFARLLVWCDGDFNEQERQIMEMLSKWRDMSETASEHLLMKLQSSGRRQAGWLKKMHETARGVRDIIQLLFNEDLGIKPAREVSASRFHMWRAVFGMAHADHVVTREEKKYLEDILSREPFSEEQKNILKQDIQQPQDIAEMFVKIEDQNDRSQFFYHARMLVWCDGDFDEQEQKIMMRLKQTHIRTIDFDQVMEHVDLSLDEEQKAQIVEDRNRVLQRDPPENFFQRMMRRLAGG